MPDPAPAPVPPASPDPANPNPAPSAPPAADPPPANPAAPSALNPPAPDPAAPPVASKWPETWRHDWAGDDAKKLARLERFTDPAKAFDALIEAQNKIRAGEFAKPLAKDATPEQVAEYRAANGIPEKPDGYFAQLPDGLVLADEDKELFTGFASALHGLNAPPGFVHKAIEWYYGMQEDALARRTETDKTQASQVIESLRTDWGPDYKATLNHTLSFLDSAGQDLKAKIMDATLPDGTRMFNSLEAVKWFSQLAREQVPIGTVVPAGNEGAGVSVDAEIASLKTLMADRNSKYWKGPEAEKNQTRYRALLEWKEKRTAA